MNEQEWWKGTELPVLEQRLGDFLSKRKRALILLSAFRQPLKWLTGQEFQNCYNRIVRSYLTGTPDLGLAGTTPIFEREWSRITSEYRQELHSSEAYTEVGNPTEDESPSLPLYRLAGYLHSGIFEQLDELSTEILQSLNVWCHPEANAVNLLSHRLPQILQLVVSEMQIRHEANLVHQVMDKAEQMAEKVARPLKPRRRIILHVTATDMVNNLQEKLNHRLLADQEKLEEDHRQRLIATFHEQFGNPFQPYQWNPDWQTDAVMSLAKAIETDLCFEQMPILADALEEAGCDFEAMLLHCRGIDPHSQLPVCHDAGCWVLDLILDREANFKELPPLKPISNPRTQRLGLALPASQNMA